MEASRRVSVVIVNWNAGAALSDCLRSLYQYHSGFILDVIVVDNAGTDQSAGMVEKVFPQVRLIRNSANYGFAVACNRGLEAADISSPYLLVLNPDTVFEYDVLSTLVSFLEAHREAAAVGPRVLGEDRTLQRGCRRREPTPGAMLSRSLGLDRLFPHSRFFAGYSYGDLPADLTHLVDSLSGSFMLVRREALERVGSFDERFFMYAEDLDWCRRAREAGWRVYYHPAVAIVHTRAVSSRQRPLARLWHFNHTAIQYIRKHHAREYPVPVRPLLYLAVAFRFMLGLPSALLDMLRQCHRKTKV